MLRRGELRFEILVSNIHTSIFSRFTLVSFGYPIRIIPTYFVAAALYLLGYIPNTTTRVSTVYAMTALRRREG